MKHNKLINPWEEEAIAKANFKMFKTFIFIVLAYFAINSIR
jgi:hypothetical protein